MLSILPAYQGPTVTAGSYGLAPMQGYVKESADRLRQLVEQYGTILALINAGGAPGTYFAWNKTWADLGSGVRDSLLTGLSLLYTDPVAATDSVLGALGKLQAQASNPINTNLLINSDFAVNQRGFAGGFLSPGTYGHDRWGAHTAGVNYSVNASTRVVTLGGGTLCQPVEVANFAGRYVTISVDSPTAAITVTVGDGAGAGSNSGTITAGSGRRSVTLQIPGITGALQVRFSGNASFSRPKCEAGLRATPWQEPLVGDTLAACLRYYFRMLNDTGSPRSFGQGVSAGTGATAARVNRGWPVPMRATPSVLVGSSIVYDGAASVAVNAVATTYHTRFGFEADLTLASAPGAYKPLIYLLNAGAFVSADAELPCNV
ncbi:hypothetical protein [Pseudomonas sp. CCOS 191]|uniref:hypothetical protein n=1 Tax=Pseudomonas sp. CCOS 191 TaxID=1649877 RepID=UPI0015A574A2